MTSRKRSELTRRDFLKTGATAASFPFILSSSRVLAGEGGEQDLLASAPERIEKHRKTDATIRVKDHKGKPVKGAEVKVEQTGHQFLFGSNIFQWGRLPGDLEDHYRGRFAPLLNFATLAFYWPNYEPRRGEPRHDYTERVAEWCVQHDIRPKGHPLAWNMGDPRWLPDDLEKIRQLQMQRIEDCVSRFEGLISTWDVVNEATHFDRKDFVERRAPKHSAMWKKVGQVEFARQCFQHARKANPDATLLINDYRTDPAYEKVIEGLVDDSGDRLYDVIGIQSHMHGGVWPMQKAWDVCERFSRFGVPLHFTETTIVSGKKGWERDRSSWKTTPEGEKRQAEQVKRFYTMLFSHPAVEAITWWDFSDYHAWQGAPAGFLRKDMSPKPAYEELKKLVKDTWWTEEKTTTNGKGKAEVRGFLGDYTVSVRSNGKWHRKYVELEKDGENEWTFLLE